jgi:hypothetical protein
MPRPGSTVPSWLRALFTRATLSCCWPRMSIHQEAPPDARSGWCPGVATRRLLNFLSPALRPGKCDVNWKFTRRRKVEHHPRSLFRLDHELMSVDMMFQCREGHVRAVPGEFRDPLLFRGHGLRSRRTCHVSLQRFTGWCSLPSPGSLSGWFPWLGGRPVAAAALSTLGYAGLKTLHK